MIDSRRHPPLYYRCTQLLGSDCSSSRSAETRREFMLRLGATAFALRGSPDPAGKDYKSATCPQVADQTVRWIVPFPPGGGLDTYSRLIEPFFEKRIGAEIMIQNIAGAGGRVGAKALMGAKPNGLTLGILSGPGLMVASMIDEGVPDPARDFTILGRLVRTRVVITTGRDSPFKTIDDVLEAADKRPIVFAVSEVGSTNLINIALTTHLLGINAEYIAGFPGSVSTVLAALRGDVDLLSHTFESVLPNIVAGELRPLLQIGAERISSHSSLDGVALLGGDRGIAARRAAKLGRDPEESMKDAEALANLFGAGLLVGAPLGMENGLYQCLESRLYDVLTDPAFTDKAALANRSLDIARGERALMDLRTTARDAKKFLPIVRETFRKLRG